jgi:hypothetical protein
MYLLAAVNRTVDLLPPLDRNRYFRHGLHEVTLCRQGSHGAVGKTRVVNECVSQSVASGVPRLCGEFVGVIVDLALLGIV